MFRDALDTDLNDIAVLANDNALLIPPLDQPAFARMLRWLHFDLAKAPRLQIVYEEDGKILAHYGAVPFSVKVRKENLFGGFAANIVIDETARKKALFFPLQKKFVELLSQRGFDFSYAMVTRTPVLKPHLAVGWKAIGELKVFARPVAAGRIISKLYPRFGFRRTLDYVAKPVQYLFDCLTVKGLNRIEISEVSRFDSSFDSFLTRWMDSQEIAAVRSTAILNWRFVGLVERNYRITVARRKGKICGYMVTRKMPMKQFSTLAIVDLIALDEDKAAVAALMNASVPIAAKEKVDLVTTAFPAHYRFCQLLYRKGFISTSEKFTLITRLPQDSTITFNQNDFKRWFINWFDHDFV